MTQTTRLGAGRYISAGQAPATTITTAHELRTSDGATVTGVLRTVPGARGVVCLMHPRQDFTHHVLVPELLARGAAVWTQTSRSVNNDLALIHEQTVLDMAAGQAFLREAGFAHVITLGHSGGGTLAALYHQQAGLAPAQRISHTPAGRPTMLADAELPLPDAAIFLAAHLGQGRLLQRLIDPSVIDETDPLSVDPGLDPYRAANGFASPPQSSSYAPEFIDRYRAAQRARISRIDNLARELATEAAAARICYADTGDVSDRRRAIAPRVITVYRTDADLRSVDQSLDPNERPYGSLLGRRPDLINYGLTGFGRFCTPDAWLSTWSANTSNADLLRCAPGVTAPTLLIELTGDQAGFPEDAAAVRREIGAVDLTHRVVRGLHFGGPISAGEPTASSLSADVIGEWIAARFPLAA
ncbi:MAG: hypothetical protein JWN03_6378 [Nocardia sp.]|uniref:alpha/beta hydrolase n=1 Tax=Nocardia sp. TaxID=1821 RepID=UPI0026363092|nr:alpha/beta hydrolase [Nocardia sp.]MCU1646103.1 hypothetical protein [Nocardia sp.]